MYWIEILWGEYPDPDDQPRKYTFETFKEKIAFLYGLEEMQGWLGYEVMNEDKFDDNESSC